MSEAKSKVTAPSLGKTTLVSKEPEQAVKLQSSESERVVSQEELDELKKPINPVEDVHAIPYEKVKLVKIKALHPIRIGENVVPPDSIIEVSESLAREFCDKGFENGFNFAGERTGRGIDRGTVYRAVRI